jgi:hypothetical protein
METNAVFEVRLSCPNSVNDALFYHGIEQVFNFHQRSFFQTKCTTVLSK